MYQSLDNSKRLLFKWINQVEFCLGAYSIFHMNRNHFETLEDWGRADALSLFREFLDFKESKMFDS